MVLIALDIPAPERPKPSIEESCSRAHQSERSEAAPQSRVRPCALPCNLQGLPLACWPAVALLLLFLAH
jgi:hypothetical protein